MQEIGGYIEFEHFHGSMLHEDGIKLDCGRSCLAYLIRSKRIQKIAMPSFLCNSMFDLCKWYNVKIKYYHLGSCFLPEKVYLDDDEYLYLVNYYGQLDKSTIEKYRDRYHHIIVDNSQAYFAEPVFGVDTLYSCRKFFGVPDGGILYTDTILHEDFEQSESWTHMKHILGRFERSASEFYSSSVENNKRFREQPIRKMSKLTDNILHAIDYEFVKRKRTENYNYLADHLSNMNLLQLHNVEDAFVYPLMLESTDTLRKKLIEKKIYIPIFWPNVLIQQISTKSEINFAKNILPLPIDQRYNEMHMKIICNQIFSDEGAHD